MSRIKKFRNRSAIPKASRICFRGNRWGLQRIRNESESAVHSQENSVNLRSTDQRVNAIHLIATQRNAPRPPPVTCVLCNCHELFGRSLRFVLYRGFAQHGFFEGLFSEVSRSDNLAFVGAAESRFPALRETEILLLCGGTIVLRGAATSRKEHTVFAKVRLVDVIRVTNESSSWRSDLNRIDRKHLDFVLCDRNLAPVLAVELDDSSHDRIERAERDDFIDRVLATAQLPIEISALSEVINLMRYEKSLRLT